MRQSRLSAPARLVGISWPSDLQGAAYWVLAGAFLLLYVPTYWRLGHTVWPTDEQGHGPIILLISAWLLITKRESIASLSTPDRSPALASALLGAGLLVYVLGRSQTIFLFEVGSQILVLVALLWMFKGRAAVRKAWFPLFFLIFMVPLPEALVSATTAPLKNAVAATASNLLNHLGYFVGRSGVILTIGPYQLLVADACAGLNTMFTLEALGLLYMNLMNYTSVVRNTLLAALLVPIAFLANVIRVCILVLITFHFGDEAGQGFAHGFAGMVLFVTALMLVLGVDKALQLFIPYDRSAS
jgi:exosortase B